jgi:AraC-like DNA-binding protein
MVKAQSETTPVLAGRAGRYDEAVPSGALRAHFQCIWTHSISADHCGTIAVVPDGCVDLLWRDDRLTVVGPDITAANPTVKAGTTILGLRFQPGAASNWLGLPMTEIVGSEVDLRDLWGQDARYLTDKMQEASSTPQQAILLQELLLPMVPHINHPAEDAVAIFRFLRSDTGSEAGHISVLRSKLDLTERTLRRRSGELFGYGPKTLDRILRFQRFQALALESANAGLAELALQAGYADQAHLSREIRSLCGMTAGEFVRQLVV